MRRFVGLKRETLYPLELKNPSKNGQTRNESHQLSLLLGKAKFLSLLMQKSIS